MTTNFHNIVQTGLSDKIFYGKIPQAAELKSIPDEDIVGGLKHLAARNVEPEHVASFFERLFETGEQKFQLVVDSILGVKPQEQSFQSELLNSEKLLKGIENFLSPSKNLAANSINVASDIASIALDPTPLSGIELAADLTVLLVRAAEKNLDQNEHPILINFLESIAVAGALTATVASIARDVSGVGILAAIGKQVASYAMNQGAEFLSKKWEESVSNSGVKPNESAIFEALQFEEKEAAQKEVGANNKQILAR